MRGVAVMLAGARAKDLQFLQLVLYLLLDCALPQYFDPEPEVGQGSKQQQPPSLLHSEKAIDLRKGGDRRTGDGWGGTRITCHLIADRLPGAAMPIREGRRAMAASATGS